MKKYILLLLISLSLKADIIYRGSCGYYDYNLSIASTNYTSAFCSDDLLYAKYSGDNYIRALVPDIENNKIYTIQADTMKMYHQFTVTSDNVKQIGSRTQRQYMALAGIASGLLAVFLLVGAI